MAPASAHDDFDAEMDYGPSNSNTDSEPIQASEQQQTASAVAAGGQNAQQAAGMSTQAAEIVRDAEPEVSQQQEQQEEEEEEESEDVRRARSAAKGKGKGKASDEGKQSLWYADAGTSIGPIRSAPMSPRTSATKRKRGGSVSEYEVKKEELEAAYKAGMEEGMKRGGLDRVEIAKGNQSCFIDGASSTYLYGIAQGIEAVLTGNAKMVKNVGQRVGKERSRLEAAGVIRPESASFTGNEALRSRLPADERSIGWNAGVERFYVPSGNVSFAVPDGRALPKMARDWKLAIAVGKTLFKQQTGEGELPSTFSTNPHDMVPEETRRAIVEQAAKAQADKVAGVVEVEEGIADAEVMEEDAAARLVLEDAARTRQVADDEELARRLDAEEQQRSQSAFGKGE